MEKINRPEKVLVATVAGIVFILGISLTAWHLNKPLPNAQKSTENHGTMKNEAWCMISSFNVTGGSFVSPEPGNNEYIVMEHGDDIEIYQKCPAKVITK